MNWKSAGITIANAAKKHSPELLIALGVIGFVGTVVMAVKTTPKAQEIIRREERRKKAPLTKKETVAATWKLYVPTAVTGLASAACILGGTATNSKRNAALAAAYATSESSMKLYREKVIETLGEKKEQLIQDEVAKEQLKRDPIENKEIFVTGTGTMKCYDPLSGRYFDSDMESIHKAEHELNKLIRDEYYVDLNEWYSLIKLPRIDLGDLVGWNSDDYPLDVRYSSQLATNGQPCLVVDIGSCNPRTDYRRQY